MQVKKIERGEAEPPPLAFYGDLEDEEDGWEDSDSEDDSECRAAACICLCCNFVLGLLFTATVMNTTAALYSCGSSSWGREGEREPDCCCLAGLPCCSSEPGSNTRAAGLPMDVG